MRGTIQICIPEQPSEKNGWAHNTKKEIAEVFFDSGKYKISTKDINLEEFEFMLVELGRIDFNQLK